MRRFPGSILAAALCIAGASCGGPTQPASARSGSLAHLAVSSAVSAARPADMTVNPGIGHVFVIVIENEKYHNAYVDNPNHYLGAKLQTEGTLLTHYYGIGHFSLDNYLAMISGQAPNPDTSGDCIHRAKFKPAGHKLHLDSDGQAVGTGCVFPAKVKTLADQLSARGVTWGGYMDSMGKKKGREQQRCGAPHLTKGREDDTVAETKKDQYAARHNPFNYFNSLVKSGLCKQHVVRLGKLPAALATTATTPAFSFITPGLCNDGHDAPCKAKDAAGSRAGGLKSVDHFLKKWVPMIQASPAYQQDGIIIITSDESETSDASSCCGEQPGPKEKKPGLVGPGGGRIGSLVIGHCVTPGVKDPTHYNHYSLLRSLEDLFGITTGGSDGKGHLGYAGASGLTPFGSDLFDDCPPG